MHNSWVGHGWSVVSQAFQRWEAANHKGPWGHRPLSYKKAPWLQGNLLDKLGFFSVKVTSDSPVHLSILSLSFCQAFLLVWKWLIAVPSIHLATELLSCLSGLLVYKVWKWHKILPPIHPSDFLLISRLPQCESDVRLPSIHPVALLPSCLFSLCVIVT